jgi:Kdo2-lipid IVA lauroyltransferase/acyltransferase
MDKPGLTIWQTVRYGAEAAGFFLLMGFFKIIGLDAASAAGGFLGRHVFTRLPPAKIARDNLRAAYPGMSADEIAKTVRAVCENLGRVVAEYPHLGLMTLGERIEVEGREYGDAAFASGKGVMFISGHFSNWETMHIAGQQLRYDGAIVERPPNNPFVARWIDKQRAILGPKVQIGKGAQGTRKIFTLLRRGKSVFLLVDQKTGQGVPAKFFGRDAMTTHAPATLALRLGAILLPASAERTDGAHFRVRIYPPIEFAPSGDIDADTLALTQNITGKIEEIVRERPAQWLWIHRRWPSDHDKKRLAKKQKKLLAGKR